MSASIEGGSNQDVELNLAPIIDCFTVLITYLLITASFINLAAMDVGVSATGSASPTDQPPGPPPMVMTLLLAESNLMTLTISGGTLKADVVVKIEATPNSTWNLNELSGR